MSTVEQQSFQVVPAGQTSFIYSAAQPYSFSTTTYQPTTQYITGSTTYQPVTVLSSQGTASNIAADLLALNSVNAVGPAAVAASAHSDVEQTIYRSINPAPLGGTEVVTVNGQTGLWTNKHEVESWRGEIPLTQYVIHNDVNPTIIRKKPEQRVLYNQEVSVRYLNPPSPAPHGDIVIKEQPNIPTGPAPPIVIRQEPPRPVTPPALIVREAPPPPPQPLPPKFLAIPGKRIPPPPRKVVVEKLPVLPQKPQSIFVERWLPFKEQTRRVVFEKNNVPDPVVPVPKNVIVQWETPDVTVRKDFKDLGVVNADPRAYATEYGLTLKQAHELPVFVRDIRPPQGVLLAAEYRRAAVPRLVGDVQALSLIDLERAGLSEYRQFVSSGPVIQTAASFVQPSVIVQSAPSTVTVSGSLESVLAEAFASVDVNADGRISVQEAERILLRLNSRLGRSYGEDDLRAFFAALDVNRDGFISFDEFRRAVYGQVALIF